MTSVTSRIKEIKQPRGGYLNPSSFDEIELKDGVILNNVENIPANIIGLVVDYISRMKMGDNKNDAFKISILGAKIIGKEGEADKLLNEINGIDDKSISAACKLVGYDVCFRAGIQYYKSVENINPDKDTIENIRTMIERTEKFYDEYGPVKEIGMTFDMKKLQMLEEEKKLRMMQEFANKVDKIIKNSKKSKRNLNYKFENFEVNSNNKKVYQSLKNYSEKLVNEVERKGLILVGNNGVGKTHLACSIANELIKNGIPIIYGTLINLLAELKNTYDVYNISEMEIIKLYEKIDLLVIDDLGKEKPSEWGLEKLFTIINSRYENNLPVIITTNYDQNSLINRLSINGEIETVNSIISRLYEMCYLVKIEYRDHRIKNKKVSNCCNNC